MNICSNFHVDICMLNKILMLANFGPENWSRILGIGPGFYSFPSLIIFVITLMGKKELVALLSIYVVLVSCVVWLFLAVSWACL